MQTSFGQTSNFYYKMLQMPGHFYNYVRCVIIHLLSLLGASSLYVTYEGSAK